MDYDDYRSEDPMRSAALVAATRCRVDYEPQEWEPETDLDHLQVCEYRAICERAFDRLELLPATDEYKAVKLNCSACEHFEDSGVVPA